MRPGDPPRPIHAEDRLLEGDAFGREVPEEHSGPIWATWRADRRRSGRTAEDVSLPLERLWSRQLPGPLTPVCAGNSLLVCGADDGRVSAFDAHSGSTVWQYLAGAAIQAAPYLWRGRIYVGDEDGWVHCLRADSGELIWRFHAALATDRTVRHGRYASLWPVGSGVLVDDGVAYFAAGLLPSEGTVVYALDARTGSVQWEKLASDVETQFKHAFVPGGPMAMSEGHLCFPTPEAAPWQISLNSSDRTPLAAKPVLFGSRRGGPQIMVAADRLISVTSPRQFVWHVKYVAEDATEKLPIVTDDAIYMLNRNTGGQKDTYLVAASRQMDTEKAASESDLIWKAWKGRVMGVLIEAGGMLFSGGKAEAYATRARDGKELWSGPIPSAVTDLAFQDGRLFAACQSGEIVCFGAPQGTGQRTGD
ncbi:MAG: outer membrane protein assembly factor BamB family protein [Planctomycetota bacterium]|jgi:outer membrane protein assembly factor BamB